jgi:xanthosine utilization system XapX-like protein
MLQLIGWLFSGVFKFFPGVPTIAVYGLTGLLAVGIPTAWAYHKGSEGKSAAVATEKAQCEIRLARMETAAERTIADILSSAEPETSENVVQYCKRNPGLCREDGK